MAILLGIGGTATGVWATLRTQRRADQTETRSETTNMTVILVELKQLTASVAELKVENAEYRAEMKMELRGSREEAREIRDRLVEVEASSKQAHKRIDRLESKEA
jgi:hypothetical protein